MNRLLSVLLLGCLLAGCQGKKKKPEVPAADFFPVKAYLSGQVAKLDTPGYRFTKIETVDGRSDTTTIPHTAVRGYAKDFLDIPDISAKDIKDDYEISHLYDDLQGAFVFTFITKEDHPVRQENVTVEPEINAEGKNNIRSIFVDLWQANGAVRKNMLWEADRSFQITTMQEAGASPGMHRIRVRWTPVDSLTKP